MATSKSTCIEIIAQLTPAKLYTDIYPSPPTVPPRDTEKLTRVYCSTQPLTPQPSSLRAADRAATSKRHSSPASTINRPSSVVRVVGTTPEGAEVSGIGSPAGFGVPGLVALTGLGVVAPDTVDGPGVVGIRFVGEELTLRGAVVGISRLELVGLGVAGLRVAMVSGLEGIGSVGEDVVSMATGVGSMNAGVLELGLAVLGVAGVSLMGGNVIC